MIQRINMHFGDLLSDYNSKEEQGDYGEFRVDVKIKKILDKLDTPRLYKDVYVESDDYVYQIDHILVTTEGVFVIETKANRGKVYGDIHSKIWTSYVYGKSTSCLNPIIQNSLHISALKDVFGDIYPYHSIIVFVENNKPDVASNIINIKELQQYLLDFKSDRKLSPIEINYFKENINDLIKLKSELRRKFISQIKSKKALGE